MADTGGGYPSARASNRKDSIARTNGMRYIYIYIYILYIIVYIHVCIDVLVHVYYIVFFHFDDAAWRDRFFSRQEDYKGSEGG